MQDNEIVGRDNDAGKCEPITEEEKLELNPEVESDGAHVCIQLQ